MKKCKNDDKTYYKGTEPSPKGKGLAAHAEEEGTEETGTDGNTWVVKKVSNGSKRWVKEDGEEEDDDDGKEEADHKPTKRSRGKDEEKEEKNSHKQSSAVTESIGKLILKTEPAKFSMETDGDRTRDLKKLKSPVRDLIHQWLIESNEESGDMDLKDYSLENLMAPEDDVDEDLHDEAYYSTDWQLLTFKGKDGTFYDFNGWPGDNESGFGTYVSKNGETTRIFTNTDMVLYPSSEEFADLVKKYEQVRSDRKEGKTNAKKQKKEEE
eukprot:TRINITY_DN8619_c0_g1_i1.p1 TRINITY_DN8619_c0_g1~~TRINITY_DN8619_c0_g1_i1.p1  ORF type:complete len:267 (+),score=83.28 TRINITY_DN8619_c0_g1_i1:199-999(+)